MRARATSMRDNYFPILYSRDGVWWCRGRGQVTWGKTSGEALNKWEEVVLSTPSSPLVFKNPG